MGRAHKLNPRQVDKLPTGVHGDGAGLSLNVTAGGSRSWLFRYMRHGKAHWLGLGSHPDTGLAEARAKAAELRELLRQGVDPLQRKRSERSAEIAAAVKRLTFEEAAAAYIERNRAGWKNAKHAQQWQNTLTTYAFPVLGKLDVGHIETAHVLRVIEPLWTTKTETASRVRGRIESVLDWCKVNRLRDGENPARWTGHLDQVLPARSKVAKQEHFAALPWSEIGAFMARLRTKPGIAARALEFAILTAARSGEVRGARWDEIDHEGKAWTVPSDRMKAGIEHRVPLSPTAMKLLAQVRDSTPTGELIFPGPRGQLSDAAMTKALRDMGLTVTAHGFRSTFRDWAGESTHHPREVIEHALAHRLADKAEAAYQRGTLFEKRRALMNDWADYCNTQPQTDERNES